MRECTLKKRQEFANLLNKYVYKENSRSGAWLGRKLNVTTATTSRWLNAESSPRSAEHVRKICDLFGLDRQQSQELFSAANHEYIESDKTDTIEVALPQFLPPSGVSSPYRGLDSFEEENADIFFGRDVEINDLLESMTQSRFVVVNGPSGSGKSSLVLAGLLPKIKDKGIGGHSVEKILKFQPGDRPLDRLAAQVHKLDDSVNEAELNGLIEQLELEPNTLWRSVRQRLLEGTDQSVVIVVDQFEEVFTLCKKQSKRQAFIQNLFQAATVLDDCIYIILTLRADYTGACAEYPELVTFINENSMLVGPISKDGLRGAIIQPAKISGCDVEPRLVDELLRDIQKEPNSLPMLQFMLLQLWENGIHGGMTFAAYDALGGISYIIADRANRELEALTPKEQTIARNILLRLIQLDDGAEDTRRRVRLSEVLPQEERKDLAPKIIDSFVDSRLLTLGYDDIFSEETIEVAHEALITKWKKLGEWLEEERDDLLFLRKVTQTAEEWKNNGFREEYLYLGERLERLLGLSGKLSALELRFLDECLLYQRKITETSNRSKVAVISLSGMLGGLGSYAIGTVILFNEFWQSAIPTAITIGAFHGLFIALAITLARFSKKYHFILSIVGGALAGWGVTDVLSRIFEAAGAPTDTKSENLIDAAICGLLVALTTTRSYKWNLIVVIIVLFVSGTFYYSGITNEQRLLSPILAFGIALLMNIFWKYT